MRPFYVIRYIDEYGNRWFSWLFVGDPYSEPYHWFKTEQEAIDHAKNY